MKISFYGYLYKFCRPDLRSIFNKNSLNIFLRCITLLSKFALIFVMARTLAPDFLGQYGIFAATTSFSLYLLGLDFYTYSTRELLSADIELWPKYLRDQMVCFFLTYGALFPTFVFIFIFEVLPWHLAGLFYLILITEHLAQELNRLLVAIGHPLKATMLLLFRQGFWVYAIIAVLLTSPAARSLETVLTGWAVGGIIAVLFGFYNLRTLPWHVIRVRDGIDWAWLSRGVRVAMPFLLGTLALRAIFTVDKYLLQYFQGDAFVGVYTFYIGVAQTIMTFADSGVFSFTYPNAVSYYRNHRFREFHACMKQMWFHTLLCSLLLSLSIAVVIYPLTLYIEKAIYLSNLNSFFILLLAINCFVLGMVPHYGLYAASQDKIIIFTHFFSLVIFILLSFPAGHYFGLLGMSCALLGTCIFASGLKFIFYQRQIRKTELYVLNQ